jgi:AcrR family transcriptional regulator
MREEFSGSRMGTRARMGTRGMPRAEREQQILEVAGKVFARGDYHSASMEEIAELVGVSKPMLYAYFGSKEGLYVAYIGRTGRELLERLIAAGSPAPGRPEPSPGARLHARIQEFFAFVEEYRDGWRVLFREASGAAVGEEVALLRGQIADGIGELIAEALPAAESHLPARLLRVSALAHAIVGAGESMANWWLAHSAASREEVASTYEELVRSAVRSLTRWSALER